MRLGRINEDMTYEELFAMRQDLAGENPHNRCTCMNWNNEDGICSYCEWEEQKVEDDQNTEKETD
jgi:hypothetical protein